MPRSPARGVGLTAGGRPSAIPLIALALSLPPLLAGCHDLTEYSAESPSGVRVLDSGDLTVLGSMTGFEGGRTLQSMGNFEFLVVANTGLLYRADSEDLTIDLVYEVGQPYGPGYSGACLAPPARVYLLGAFDQLVEFSYASGAVLDEFPAGPHPVAICASPSLPRLYVCDGQDALLREVLTSDNTVFRTGELESPASAIVPSTVTDGLFFAVSEEEPMAWRIYTDGFLAAFPVELPAPACDVAALQDTAVFLAVHRGSGSDGSATLAAGAPLIQRMQNFPLSGQPVCACVDLVHDEFFVGSRLGDGNSRIYRIGFPSWDIEATGDIAGDVVDITTHSAGDRLLVLVSP